MLAAKKWLIMATKEWCEKENVGIAFLDYSPRDKPPTRMRCKKCKRRFKPFFRDDSDGDRRWFMPKHKAR